MAPGLDSSVGFQTACVWVLEGTAQLSIYTKPVLHRTHQEAKCLYAH